MTGDATGSQVERLVEHLQGLLAMPDIASEQWSVEGSEDPGKPALFTVHTVPGEGSIYLRQLEISDRLWFRRGVGTPLELIQNLPDILNVMAQATSFSQLIPPNFLGFVFRHEAYLSAIQADSLEEAARKRDAMTVPVREMQGATEALAYYAATSDMSLMMATVTRGGELQSDMVSPDQERYRFTKDSTAPRALLRAVRVVKWHKKGNL